MNTNHAISCTCAACHDKDRKCTCGYPAHACTGDNSPHYARMREIDNHSNDNECGILSDYTGD